MTYSRIQNTGKNEKFNNNNIRYNTYKKKINNYYS